MIKALRVDHRLLHGQVAFAWTGYLDADCILIANDAADKDDLMKTTLRLAKPQGVKLVIKGIDDSVQAIKEGKTDKYKLFIVVENVEDAYQLASKINEIDVINVGSVKAKENAKFITRNVSLREEDENYLKKLVEMGKDVEIRTVPSERPKKYE